MEEEIVVENEQEIEIDNQEENPIYPMNGIKVDKGFYSVFELKRRFDSEQKRIILDSDFQREDVWNRERKAELIESVLMGLPLPIFYFNQDKYGRLIVIDGRQRLTALFEYMDNKFPLNKLKVLEAENTKYFSELTPILKGRIEDYQIQAHVIMPPTPDRLKFDIFDRVNRGGMQLNKQEIRNALYQGNATKLLNEIVISKEFQMATENAFIKEKRMKDKYLVTRFLAIYLYKSKLLKDENGEYVYHGDIDELLGIGLDHINHMNDSDLKELANITLKALQKVTFYCGHDAFRLMNNERRTPINMNVFETIMYALIYVPENNINIKSQVYQSLKELVNDEKFRDNIGNHRDSNVKLMWRIKQAEVIGKALGKK